MEVDINFNGYNLIVIGEYTKGEPQEWDYPGSPSEFRIYEVYDQDGCENTNIKSNFDEQHLREQIIEKLD